MIIAKQDILYQGRTYKTGDALPEQDVFQVGLWLKAGSAHRVAEQRKKVKKAAQLPASDPVRAPDATQPGPPVQAAVSPVGDTGSATEKPARKQAKGKAQEAADEKPAGESQG